MLNSLWSGHTYIHTYARMYIYTHTHTHTHAHVYTHSHSCSHIHIRMHARVHTHSHTHMHTHMRSHTTHHMCMYLLACKGTPRMNMVSMLLHFVKMQALFLSPTVVITILYQCEEQFTAEILFNGITLKEI